MFDELTYQYNDRRYRLAADGGGWVLTCGRVQEYPVPRTFTHYHLARESFWRIITSTILCNPRRLHAMRLDDTLLVLVPDHDGRVHLVEDTAPGTHSAVAFTDRATALTAWRDRCHVLASAAARNPHHAAAPS